ncbi:MAG: hypothetical protein KDH88_03000 [Chromatiales bacterium]|nr:hypothetical protein [Chromatiales bacterium]
MEFLQFRRRYSAQVLIRLVIFSLALVAIVFWKWDFFRDIYLRNQLTSAGLLINSAIVLLFLLGMLKIIGTLLIYAREERALSRFIENLQLERNNLLTAVSKRSIIARRVGFMRSLYERRAPVSHSAMAATLVAAESTRTSLPKFINNVLILTGVFGTIVSLSIALLGASNLLESTVDPRGMGLVIHGMSTALSTTITAIICYLFFGYFYLKLTDTQTNLLSAVEQVTANNLVPLYNVEPENVLYEFSGLIRSLHGLVNQMSESQQSFDQAQKQLASVVGAHGHQIEELSEGMRDIRSLLREGFRLGER